MTVTDKEGKVPRLVPACIAAELRGLSSGSGVAGGRGDWNYMEGISLSVY